MVPYAKDWTALGTTVHVLTTNEESLAAAGTAVREILADVDATYSRFREDSELSRLTAHGAGAVRVSPLMALAIEVAQRAAQLSEGAVNPTIGRAIRLAGYDDDFSRLRDDAGPFVLHAERVPGWQEIRFDRRARTLRLPAGVELDFGSTGKALAADLAAAAARDTFVEGGVLVSLGGDIATAGSPPPGGWRTLVADDSATSPDGPGETICLHGGGLATSSTSVRRWTRGGVFMHHIIDPGTGLPAVSPFRTVTVAAANCVDANTAATAAIVRGPWAIEWLKAQRLPARLVEHDGTIHYLGPWPDPQGASA